MPHRTTAKLGTQMRTDHVQDMLGFMSIGGRRC